MGADSFAIYFQQAYLWLQSDTYAGRRESEK